MKLKLEFLLSIYKTTIIIDRKIFVFKASSDKNIINIYKSMGFNTILLDSSKDKSWSFNNDSYWT